MPLGINDRDKQEKTYGATRALPSNLAMDGATMTERKTGHHERQLWARLRRRMLAETTSFLERGLKAPDWKYRIPTIEVGQGEFPRGYSSLFWAQYLATS